MKQPLRILVWGAVALGLAIAARTGWRLHTSVQLARMSEPLQHRPPQPALKLLIVGDSTAVGTGASAPQASVAGLLAQRFPRLQIDNRAQDGATFAGLLAQLDGDDRYDLVLVMAGGNDVVRLRDLAAVRLDVEKVLQRARQRAGRVVLMTAGNVGNAPLFLPPVSGLMTWRARRLQDIATDLAARGEALRVNLFREAADDPFVLRPELNAADGLHPSDAGYRVWFDELMAQADLPRHLSAAGSAAR